MPGLTSGEIVSMRATVEDHLSGTAILYSKTATSDGQGGRGTAYTVAGTVAARLAPLAGSEETVADRLAEVARMVLTIPAETSLSETSRVVYNGRSYDIDRIVSRTPEELSRRVVVTEVR